jgi:hypothetical protein
MSCSDTPRCMAVSDCISLAEGSEGGDSAEAGGYPWRQMDLPWRLRRE